MRVLYGSTREDELAATDWSRGQKDAFLDHQFAAQTAYYREHMPRAKWYIILVDGADAGRLVLDSRPGDLRIVDITVHPDFRGRGAGSHFLASLQRDAAEAGHALSIHVEHRNRARQLYERLGFVPVPGGSEVYQLMEWRPA